MENASWSEQGLTLEAGDRVLFLTDGMLERNAESLDIPAQILASAHLHPREAIQYLTDSVLDAVDGKLQDDASSLCFDWHGGAQRDRVAHAGAEHRTPRERHSPRRLSRADGPAKRVASLGPQA